MLEHVNESADYVEKVARLLNPGGRFIFLVTNFNSVQGRFYEMNDFPRHVNLFNKRSARLMFERVGLQMLRHRTDQQVFGVHLQGCLVYAVDCLLGYSRSEVMGEWKNDLTLDVFFRQWRGRPSSLIRQISRIDWVLLAPIGKLMDCIGMGFILTIEAQKPMQYEKELGE